MEKKYKTICILIICYKQQELIKRALDSILKQKEYGITRIVVSDDCSPDKTWDVLTEYHCKFPDLIEIHRNDCNLGIYQNLEKVISLRGEYDLYCELSGDDAFEDGFFMALQEYIMKHDIDFTRPVGFYGNYQGVTPTGKVYIKKQDVVKKNGVNLFSLYLRLHISSRSCLVNDAVIRKTKPTILDKGLNLAESLHDVQMHMFIKEVHYIDAVGNIYYSGIGVSTELRLTSYYKEQAIIKWKYFLDNLIKNENDKRYAYAEISKALFLIKPSLYLYIKALCLFLMSGYPAKPSFRQCRTFLSPMKRRVFRKYETNKWIGIFVKILYKI